mmetsp:Transcript_2446/g.9539  ORF Transcript_2446/g.9539 Transcript_2446/m.9539 type:complete len:205 (-) Transcript_2446:742-1356(-)
MEPAAGPRRRWPSGPWLAVGPEPFQRCKFVHVVPRQPRVGEESTLRSEAPAQSGYVRHRKRLSHAQGVLRAGRPPSLAPAVDGRPGAPRAPRSGGRFDARAAGAPAFGARLPPGARHCCQRLDQRSEVASGLPIPEDRPRHDPGCLRLHILPARLRGGPLAVGDPAAEGVDVRQQQDLARLRLLLRRQAQRAAGAYLRGQDRSQ